MGEFGSRNPESDWWVMFLGVVLINIDFGGWWKGGRRSGEKIQEGVFFLIEGKLLHDSGKLRKPWRLRGKSTKKW